MSDSSKKPAEPRVNMNKPAAAAKPGEVPRPRTINYAMAAIGALVALSLAEAASLWGFTPEFSRLLKDSNAKAKKPKSPYGPTEIAHDLHQFRIGQLVQTVVVGLALAFLVVALRRVRSAGVARWALVVVMVLTNGPVALIPVSGMPGLPTVLRVLLGAASLTAIVMLFLPASSQYFRNCKAASLPEGAPPRPGLRDLFAGRAAAAGGSTGTQPAKPAGASPSVPANPSAIKAKAKTRVDDAAVAKGAELARTRAKASKSRRTES